jgi:CBS domain-containing protein
MRLQVNLDRTVADLMTAHVVSIATDASIWELASLLARERISAVPVVDGAGRAVGVASASDLLWVCDRLLEPESGMAGGPSTVGEVMTPDVFSVEPAMTLRALCRFFQRAGVHRAVVLEEGRLVGVVSLTDLLGYVAAPSLNRP